ncbi:MAG: SRPBCC domain-containing protein [Parvibaculaceae bacterium]
MLAKPSLTIRRRFNTAPAKVYAAWTEPAQIVRWFGPGRAEVRKAEIDLREGGRFHIIFYSPEDGEDHDVSGVYREVVKDRTLCFTWAWKSTPERESLVTVTLKPDGDGTWLTLHHEQFFDQAARDAHHFGWSGTLERLAGLFE